MTKTTIRLAALAAALLFGAATVLPVTATAANAPTKPTAAHSTAKHKKKTARSGGSAAVKNVQQALNKNGANVAVDGKMGPKTKAALKSFQQGHGLKATGKLDKATKAALSRG